MERMDNPSGSNSALLVLSRGVLWELGVCVNVCVYMCAGGNRVKREERHRQAWRAAGIMVSRREKAGEAQFREGFRRKS